MVSPKILIVDDNDAMRHAVSRMMNHAGYEVLEADCGEDCLKLARAHHPDLILLDVQLPDISGFEVLQRLKGDEALNDIFVVHLSAEKTDATSKAAGLEFGADGYIAQPVENKELVARVKGYLRHKTTMDQLRDSEARYRVLFESNPQPMWIYEATTGKFLAVNDAAVAHYGSNRTGFLSLKVNDLRVYDENRSHAGKKATAGPVGTAVSERHRKHNGGFIDVEITEHALQWKGVDAIAALITDVTERKQIERERERLIERYERELQSLEEITRSRQSVTHAQRNIFESAPQTFESLRERYDNLLQMALEQKVYKVNHNVSAGLRSIAEQLFAVKATPRDVVELHFTTLKKLIPQPEAPQAQGYLEISRLAIVELMGYLVSAYRDRFLEQKPLLKP